ncbi:MAG TPA: hypothetical protein VHU19_09245 [Pyrinomonadaceae bacterium]|jgi:hypothetical protein|nr:hypothetical protein [Pyrinomonadaceae bacterium]
MAKNETKRLNPSVLEADKTAFAALQSITNYTPANPAYTTAAVAAAHDELLAAQTTEAQTAAAAAAARDNAVSKEWNFHNLMLIVKDHATAQFGRNSNEVQSLGRKKASEYKPRARKSKPPQT